MPVAVGTALALLSAVNVGSVRAWQSERDDGVVWQMRGSDIIASQVMPGSIGDLAGLKVHDRLVRVDDYDALALRLVEEAIAELRRGREIEYVVQRLSQAPINIRLVPEHYGLYYSLVLVGILSLVVGVSTRLRRPHDEATLHFFWLSVAFFGTCAFHSSGKLDQLDRVFWWADLIARVALPPLLLHFALIFPERRHRWIRSRAGRFTLCAIYAPSLVLVLYRVHLVRAHSDAMYAVGAIDRVEYAWLTVGMLGSLVLSTRMLRRLRSVTGQRQLRWMVWAASVGAVPFTTLYNVPFIFGKPISGAEYTSVLLGCIPLGYSSAIVRYRLMDIEVIIKKILVAISVITLLSLVYLAAMQIAAVLVRAEEERRSWSLFATLIVSLIAPSLWSAIQNGVDRLYYRDRYDYRRALVGFARELNSDLDLDRLSARLLERVSETLGVSRVVLFLRNVVNSEEARFVPLGWRGFDQSRPAVIEPRSMLAERLRDGMSIMIEESVATRRLDPSEAASWRDAGLLSFVPCVSQEVTIAVLASGRRALNDPLSSEDLALLLAVGAQAATAIESARLYKDVERLREFSDGVVESLADGLLVFDMSDGLLRWNKRLKQLMGTSWNGTVGQPLTSLFDEAFVGAVREARRERPEGATLYRLWLGDRPEGRAMLVNATIAPFMTENATEAGWILVLQDVTERVQLEEQLRFSQKMSAMGLLPARGATRPPAG